MYAFNQTTSLVGAALWVSPSFIFFNCTFPYVGAVNIRASLNMAKGTMHKFEHGAPSTRTLGAHG